MDLSLMKSNWRKNKQDSIDNILQDIQGNLPTLYKSE